MLIRRGPLRPKVVSADTPLEKQKPKFVKIRDIRPGRNFDIVVKVPLCVSVNGGIINFPFGIRWTAFSATSHDRRDVVEDS